MKELRDLDCKNKKIIVRVDLNVPVLEGTITDHSRIHAILPTLEKPVSYTHLTLPTKDGV